MSHKVHPKIYRVKQMSDWDSRGFYEKEFPKYLREDFLIRQFLAKRLEKAAVERIEIERSVGKVNIIIYSSRPGFIIGRGGEGIETLRKELMQKVLSKADTPLYLDVKQRDKAESGVGKGKNQSIKQEVRIEIREVKSPWASASLAAQTIAQQIEKRIPHKRVIKAALAKISANKEVQGVKIEVSGRLDGNEIARRAWLKSGKLPLQTIRAEIDFSKAEAFCTYGTVGIKVWIYKGERFEKENT